MSPLLLDEDVVYLKKIKFSSIKVNDIVTFRKNRVFQTHRVIYKAGKYLVTKGDNNLKADGKVFPKQIVGKVYKVKRAGKTFNPEDIYLFQSTLYFQEIVKIKRLFEEQKIDFVFLKGLPLHLYLENSYPRRIYADSDVLIDKKQFKKAKRILEKEGYKQNDTSLSKTQEKLKDKITEVSFYKNYNGIIVTFDVHAEPVFMMVQLGRLDALYPQRLIDRLTESFLQNKHGVKIQNEFFPILSPTHLSLYLALHFFHDNYRGAYKLELFSKVMSKYIKHASYLALLAEEIRDYKLENYLYPSFYLLKKYYLTALPSKFLNSIKPIEKTIKKQLGTNIFDLQTRFEAGRERFLNLFFYSPNSFLKRLTIVFNVQVIYMAFLIISRRILLPFSSNFVLPKLFKKFF